MHCNRGRTKRSSKTRKGEPSANQDEALGALLAKSVLVLDLVAGELEQIAAMRGDDLAVGVLGNEGPLEGAGVARGENFQILELSVRELAEKSRNTFPYLFPPFIARAEQLRAERGMVFAVLGEKTQHLFDIVRVPCGAELGCPLQGPLRAHACFLPRPVNELGLTLAPIA